MDLTLQISNRIMDVKVWTTTNVNIPLPFFAKNQEISKKQAENKQKSAGG